MLASASPPTGVAKRLTLVKPLIVSAGCVRSDIEATPRALAVAPVVGSVTSHPVELATTNTVAARQKTVIEDKVDAPRGAASSSAAEKSSAVKFT
jgi:hypothetical protein